MSTFRALAITVTAAVALAAVTCQAIIWSLS